MAVAADALRSVEAPVLAIAVGTIITMSTAYGRDLGFGIAMLITVLLVIQVVAFPCTLLYGRMAARFKTRTLLMTGIVIYCLITFLAFLLPFI